MNDLNIQWDRESVPSVTERKLAIVWAIGAKLRKLGHKTGVCYVIDGHSIVATLSEDSIQRGYSRKPSNKLRFVFGNYGSKRQFPEPKSGFDIDKIAGLMSQLAKEAAWSKTARDDQTSKKEANHTALLEILESFNVPVPDGYRQPMGIRCPAIMAHSSPYDHGYANVRHFVEAKAHGIDFETGAFGSDAVKALLTRLGTHFYDLSFILKTGESTALGESHRYAQLTATLSPVRFANLLKHLLALEIVETVSDAATLNRPKEAANG